MLPTAALVDELAELDLALRSLYDDGRLALEDLRPVSARLPDDLYGELRARLRDGLPHDCSPQRAVESVELLALGYTAAPHLSQLRRSRASADAARDHEPAAAAAAGRQGLPGAHGNHDRPMSRRRAGRSARAPARWPRGAGAGPYFPVPGARCPVTRAGRRQDAGSPPARPPPAVSQLAGAAAGDAASPEQPQPVSWVHRALSGSRASRGHPAK